MPLIKAREGREMRDYVDEQDTERDGKKLTFLHYCIQYLIRLRRCDEYLTVALKKEIADNDMNKCMLLTS